MEVGTEISQKIRSAIKAKLIELGAYVDDELPDYIMVMVANKKSREQMISDLSLFLGKNTDTFAEWLHGLLGKLQTISVDSNATKNVKEKKKPESKKDRKVKKSSKGGEGSSQAKKVKSKKSEPTDGKIDKTVNSKSKGLSETSDQLKQKENTPNAGNEKETSLPAEPEIEDVRQMLVTVAPTDELAAELETTETRIEQSQQATVQVGISVSADSGKDVNSATRTSSVQRKRSASPTSERRVQSSSGPKKHKGLTSVVASVVSKDEEEEEYDPLCPAVGSVASVVKVTNRKSKVPQALQANSDVLDPSAMEVEVSEPEVTTAESIRSVSDSHETGSIMVRLEQTASMDRIRTALMEVLKQSKDDGNSNNDDIGAFCQSIASCLRKMNQRNLAIAKLRIQKILFDYESSIQAGGNDRWTSGTSNSGSSGGVNNSNLQISSSGNDRSTMRVASRQQNTHNTNSSSAPIGSNEGTSSKSKVKPTSDTSVNALSVSVTRGLDSPSSSSQPKSLASTSKSDQSLVTSSSKNDRLSPFCHSNQNEFSTKSLRSHQTNSSELNLSTSQSKLNQPSTSSNKTIDHSHSSPSQPISLDSLHLKRRSDTEPSSGKGSTSVLKFGSSSTPGGSGDTNGQNSGMESPKPLSAEQLRVLAKNLKITIKNSHAKSSDEDESDSSSEGSGEESDSEEEEEDDDPKKREQSIKSSNGRLKKAGVAEDSREIESESSAVRRKRVLGSGARDLDEIASATDPDDKDSDTDRNDIAAALTRPRN